MKLFSQCLGLHIHSCRISIICQVLETLQTIDFPQKVLFMELVRLEGITGGVTWSNLLLKQNHHSTGLPPAGSLADSLTERVSSTVLYDSLKCVCGKWCSILLQNDDSLLFPILIFGCFLALLNIFSESVTFPSCPYFSF